MAKGRILKAKITENEDLGGVSVFAALCFTWMIPHADVEGRLTGRARALRARLFGMREDVSVEDVESALYELSETGLIQWYEVDGTRVVWLTGFSSEQKLRPGRESDSEYPAWSSESVKVSRTHEAKGEMSPGLIPDSSSLKRREGKRRKEKQTAQRVEPSDEFLEAWRAYPKREGHNPRKRAWHAWRASIRDKRGTPEHMAIATQHYASYCHDSGQLGTRFVMQASTFYGPSDAWKGYLEPVEVTEPASSAEAAEKARLARAKAAREAELRKASERSELEERRAAELDAQKRARNRYWASIPKEDRKKLEDSAEARAIEVYGEVSGPALTKVALADIIDERLLAQEAAWKASQEQGAA